MTDKSISRIASGSVLVALLIAFLIPLGESGRIVAAILLLPAAVLIPFFIKKRNILSINKDQVFIIVAIIALLYVMIYYLSGLAFGFYKNPYGISVFNFFKFFLPSAAIIVCTEIIRCVLVAQKDKLTTVLCYAIGVVADILIVINIPAVNSFNKFMDLIAGSLFPALISNFLYIYLSKRYGIFPNLSFRAITTLYVYIFHVVPGISDSIANFAKLIIPLVVYLFIDVLYEKKRKYALGNTSRFLRILSIILTICVLVIMIGTVMLISNQFKYGLLVIATESMTGEINKGDVVIFEDYENQSIKEGQVIVFERYGNMIVHRVVDIEIINGNARYYTKGDANEDRDSGFITDAEIRGVASKKIPFIGYPSLWVRQLFKR